MSNHESARQMLEQAEFLLRDEIKYADTLKASRNNVAGLTSLVLGIGLFQIEIRGNPSDVLLVEHWALWGIRICMTAAVAALAIGILYLFTNQPGKPVTARDLRDNPSLGPHKYQKTKATAALAVFDLKEDSLKQLEDAEPEVAIRVRTRLTRLSYDRLVQKNRSVRYRVELGRRWVLLAFVFVLAAFLVYLWGSDRAAVSGDPDGSGTQSAFVE
ncbi:MAG: hypothetical protein AAF235_08115 [Planctomycetota bacterium]